MSNNRKRTKGRKFHYQDITLRKNVKDELVRDVTIVKEDKGFTLHKAIKHLVGHDNLLNTDIYTKQGKGKVVDKICTMPAGEPLKVRIKTIIHRIR